MATGGCAFKGGGIGCNVLTGDGALMAAEVGCDVFRMEFSNAYAVSASFASVTKLLFYHWATFTDESGAAIDTLNEEGGIPSLARALDSGAVYARLDKASPEQLEMMRKTQPIFFLPFDREGIDPRTERFPITLRFEGTVRGTGGVAIVRRRLRHGGSGALAVGDLATRELICGGFTGGGDGPEDPGANGSWAICSGCWAGEAAAAYAKRARLRAGRVDALPAGRAGAVARRYRPPSFVGQHSRISAGGGRSANDKPI